MVNFKKEIVVYTSGSWDLFHIGHLNILEKSALLGDKLIVGVSTDELIEKYKGMKPIIPFEQRFKIIESLKMVSKVVKQTKLTDTNQLKEFDVDIVTIGNDWENKSLEGLEWMKSQGKKVVYFPYTSGISTTSIKKDIINRTNQIIQANLEREEIDSFNWEEKKD